MRNNVTKLCYLDLVSQTLAKFKLNINFNRTWLFTMSVWYRMFTYFNIRRPITFINRGAVVERYSLGTEDLVCIQFTSCVQCAAWKVPKYGFFCSLFSLIQSRIHRVKTPYYDTFLAVVGIKTWFHFNKLND